jgi:hypothetical protein
MSVVGRIVKTGMAAAVVIGVLAVSTAYSEGKVAEKLRRFSDRDGNSFRGFVTAYDEKTDVVSIRRLDGKRGQANLSVFSDEDQKYIREWGVRDSFLTGITIVPKLNSERNELIDGDGDTIKTLWDVNYELSLENTTSYDFKNVTMEYCIFYRQGTREDETMVYSEGISHGKSSIEVMKSSEKRRLKTDPIKLYSERGRGTSFGMVDSRAEYKVRGIWVRLSVQLPNGEVCVRDFRTSDDDFWKWVPRSHDVGLNVDTTKKKPLITLPAFSSQ